MCMTHVSYAISDVVFTGEIERVEGPIKSAASST